MLNRLGLPIGRRWTVQAISIWTIALSVLVSSSALGQDKQESTRQFRAGAAASNITPMLGGGIVGGWGTPQATHIHDELHARCLALDDGQTRLALAICDSVGIAREVFDEAKQLVNNATGLPLENMLMSATHTHSATSARGRNSLVRESLSDYQSFLARRIADGVVRAINNLEPARIGWGVGHEPSQLFNRRWHLKPGTPLLNPWGGTDLVKMNPGAGNPDLLEPAGPTDPGVSFISVQSATGRPIALLANYSLHYVGGTRGNEISADYFAMFADQIQQLLGADRLDPPFVGIMSNGTSGDVNNINFREPRGRQAPYEQMRKVANIVAAEVFKAHQTIQFQDWVPLAAMTRELELETRKPTAEMLERSKKVLAGELKDPRLPHEEEYARRTLLMAESPSHISIPLQTLRIGDLGIAAIPFEVFTESGLDIKQRSPFKTTFTIELANGSYGYLPTPAQHELGGYETWLGTNRVEIQAAPKIVDTLLQMFERLKDNRGRQAASQ